MHHHPEITLAKQTYIKLSILKKNKKTTNIRHWTHSNSEQAKCPVMRLKIGQQSLDRLQLLSERVKVLHITSV